MPSWPGSSAEVPTASAAAASLPPGLFSSPEAPIHPFLPKLLQGSRLCCYGRLGCYCLGGHHRVTCQGDWQAAGDRDGDGRTLLFLDLGGWGDGAAVGAGGQAQGGHRQLGRGRHAVGPCQRVGKEGAPKALAPALPPIAVDDCLELVGVAEATALTLK